MPGCLDECPPFPMPDRYRCKQYYTIIFITSSMPVACSSCFDLELAHSALLTPDGTEELIRLVLLTALDLGLRSHEMSYQDV